MPDPRRLEVLAAELRGLRGRDRRSILGALSPAERSQLAALIDGRASTPAPVEETAAPLFSPWLSARIAGSSGNETWQISPATRDALAAALRTLQGGSPTPTGNTPGRSLAGVLTDLLKRPRR